VPKEKEKKKRKKNDLQPMTFFSLAKRI